MYAVILGDYLLDRDVVSLSRVCMDFNKVCKPRLEHARKRRLIINVIPEHCKSEIAIYFDDKRQVATFATGIICK